MNPSYSVPYIYPDIKRTSPITVTVPGSKSITNRALLLSALAQGTTILQGALFSDDSRHFLNCLRTLGFETEIDEDKCCMTVTGHTGRIPRKEASLYVGSAGTAARFLTAFLGVSKGVYRLDSSEQMRRRPMAGLLASMRELGCGITCQDAEDHFPFILTGNGFGTDKITVDVEHSSQFLSALLIVSCLAPHSMTIRMRGTHGMSYIEMTRKMMEQFGVKVQKPEAGIFYIPAPQSCRALNYEIEPDVSGACYFYALCPLLNVPVKVNGVHSDSLQGDVEFLHILEKMGAHMQETGEGILLSPPVSGHFPGVDVDMSACSDQAITLAAIAPFADSPTTIRGIGHIRFQESDRITAIREELTKMKIKCEEGPDSLTIYPGKPQPSQVDTRDDHRLAMGFTLTGLRSPGIVIRDPGCCRKTFENYFEILEQVIYELTGESE